MRNISLNNEQLVTIASNRDILEIIEENLSYELAEYISDILWNQEEIDDYIADLEKENDELKDKNSELEETMSEYYNPNLWNDSYFNYLCENGGWLIMAKYLVDYYETYSKSYEIEADSKEEAEEKVRYEI